MTDQPKHPLLIKDPLNIKVAYQDWQGFRNPFSVWLFREPHEELTVAKWKLKQQKDKK